MDRQISGHIFRPNEQWRGDVLTRKELQPIPDYVRWVSTGGELHYLTFEKRLGLKGDWDNSPGLFRPERLLDILISINSDPPDYIFHTIASFVWLTENDTRQYFTEQHEKFRHELREDLEREKWKGHKLFANNVDALKEMCRKKGLSAKGPKHHLVERIATATNEGALVDENYKMTYTGNFQSIPSSISNLRKL